MDTHSGDEIRANVRELEKHIGKLVEERDDLKEELGELRKIKRSSIGEAKEVIGKVALQALLSRQPQHCIPIVPQSWVVNVSIPNKLGKYAKVLIRAEVIEIDE